MKAQGISASQLPWASGLAPFAPWVGLIGSGVILITGGYTVFLNGHWDKETFVSSYFNIPFILLFYFGFKWIRKTKIVPLENLPIMYFINKSEWNEMSEQADDEPKTLLQKAGNLLWG